MQLQEVAPRSLPSAYESDDRLAMMYTVREFAMKKVLPAANALDPISARIPEDVVREMADMGLFGLLIPERHGGLGLGVFEYCLVAEELSRAWMSVASIISRGNILGDELPVRVQPDLLPRMARGEWLGAMAISEPDAGSDMAGIRTRAERRGDGWVLTGQKMWCTFADQADFLIIVARTEPYDAARRNAGLRNFYIPKQRGSFPDGISGTPIRKIGYHGWDTWELALAGVELPADALVGQVHDKVEGFRALTRKLSVARMHTAARSIGLARGALEDAVAYTQVRRQFEHPLCDFQAIRFKVADMAAQIETCRAMLHQVAADHDAGRAVDAQASMVKYLASEMSERVTSEALQIHGGAGYTTDFPVERYWRDARLTKIFEGTSEIQQRIISDTYLPRTGGIG